MKTIKVFQTLVFSTVFFAATYVAQAQQVTSISASNVSGTVSLKNRNVFALKTEIAPANAANKTVSYSIDNQAIATVSATGEITGLTAGSATITIAAEDGSGITATVPVTVSSRTPELAVNHPDGPYIFYNTTSGDKVVSVDADGYIVEKVYAQLPENYTFTVFSDVIESGKSARSAFEVTIPATPLTRPAATRPAPDSLIVLSDIHAKWKEFASILKAHKVIDDNFNWIYNDNELMIIGDVFDRGDDATTCLWLIYKLQQQALDAGGQVYLLYGNHEEMVIRNNHEYVNAKYTNLATKYGISSYGSGFFNANTELGRWFRDAWGGIQVIGKDIFVHAGLSNSFYTGNYDLEAMNATMANDILKTSGRHSFFFSTGTSSATGGPLWTRGFLRSPELPLETLEKILARYNVERVVIGHTEVQQSANIVVSNHPLSYNYYNYRVLNVNVPTNTAFNSYGRGALVLKNGDTYCIYDSKANVPIVLPNGALAPPDDSGTDPTDPTDPGTDPGTGDEVVLPTYSTAENEIWYYIRFVSNNLVIQSQGAEKMLTIEIPVENQDNQLWKVETAAGDLVTISNKAVPSIKLRYVGSGPDGGSGFYGTTAVGTYGEPRLMPDVCTVNGKAYPSLHGRPTSTLGYLLRPEGNTPGSKIKRNPNGTTSGLPENAICFVLPENLFTGINTSRTPSLKAYQTSSSILTVELPEDAKNIVIRNATGQMVKQVKPTNGSLREISISDFATGIYILQVDKLSETETLKFLVKK
ncbi:MAG: metallophosphoesterase [Prevotellaceae bacterium]|jgi:hypothetical protein|nr:metallophosphoesterase [Prevotellaceae bacterium]